MKKWAALLLALVMCLALCACGGNESASESSQQEIQGSEDAAATAEPVAAEKETRETSEPVVPGVVYDENGIFVEIRGTSEDQVVVYAENDMDAEIILGFDDILYNGKYNVGLGNDSGFVQGHSVYLSTAQHNFIISDDDAKEYGIDKIQSIDCVLRIEYMKEGFRETMAEVPVSIPCDIKLS